MESQGKFTVDSVFTKDQVSLLSAIKLVDDNVDKKKLQLYMKVNNSLCAMDNTKSDAESEFLA
jgi:hypothetical protein